MKHNSSIITLSGIIPVLLILAVWPLHGENQAWVTNSLSYKAGSRLTFMVNNEMRFETLTFKDRKLYNWQGLVAYRIGKEFFAATGFHLEKTDTLQFVLEEHRYIFDLGWKKRFAGTLDFLLRIRTEVRRFDDSLADDHLRFRLKGRLSARLPLGLITARPYIAIEYFGDDLDNEINQYRFFAGAVFPVTRNLGLILGYIKMKAKNREALHILNTGLKIAF